MKKFPYDTSMPLKLSSTETGLLARVSSLRSSHVVLNGSSGGSTESQRGTPLYTGTADVQTRTEEENWVTSGEDVAK